MEESPSSVYLFNRMIMISKGRKVNLQLPFSSSVNSCCAFIDILVE